jgi:hypothetical protein
MGVLQAFINLDKGIYVKPTNVNLKAPDEQPYAAFIVWLIRNPWSGDRVMFMGDSSSAWDGWRDSKGTEKTKALWDEFVIRYSDIFPDLEPEPYEDDSDVMTDEGF